MSSNEHCPLVRKDDFSDEDDEESTSRERSKNNAYRPSSMRKFKANMKLISSDCLASLINFGKSRSHSFTCVFFSIMVMLILSTILILIQSIRGRDGEANNSADFCTDSGCVLAAANLLNSIDFSVDPCQNFYEYACGTWKKNNPIPDDRSSYSIFGAVDERVKEQLRLLLEDHTDENRTANSIRFTKLLFKKCMDKDAINSLKSKPLQEFLLSVGGWPVLNKTWDENFVDLTTLSSLTVQKFGEDSLASLDIIVDMKNVTNYILSIDQMKLILGESTRDYYLNDTAYGKQMTAYRETFFDMVRLIGTDMNVSILDEEIADDWANLISFEKKLANITVPEEERRNLTLLYNKMSLENFSSLLTVIDWEKYLQYCMPIEVFDRLVKGKLANFQLIVTQPVYFERLNTLLTSTDKKTLVNYILWRLIRRRTLLLDQRFWDVDQVYDDDFCIFSHLLKLSTNICQKFKAVYVGRKVIPNRWKICVDVAKEVEMASGALYIRKYFSAKDKQEAHDMIVNLKEAFKAIVYELDWMDDVTRNRAIEKADYMTDLVGYPDFTLNDSTLDNYYKNLSFNPQSSFFHFFFDLAIWSQNREFFHLLEAYDRNKFSTNPATVNAFNSLSRNVIVFPAGILQPPFFHRDYPKYVNYASMGAIIGHELTHGFDDKGSQFGKIGSLENWWQPSVEEKFRSKTQCIQKQYGNFVEPLTKKNVNGIITLGENIADNGGVKQALKAYKNYIKKRKQPERRLPGLNLTNEQTFFASYALSSGLGEPAIWHALVIIFLEFFSWGLLTVPVINVLAETFPTNKFLMNGFILGVKGLLSFLSAPLIGALSDIWGRKFFLILTVFSTCMPIPLLTFSPWWYFALFSISGLFSATYSVVLAYVADITEKEQRNTAYGLVSATFGASLVTSPALGAFLSENLNNEVVVALATAIACLDVFFIMVAVPESLPTKLRHSWDRVTWEAADPFATLRKVGEDFTVMLLCVVVFLSYLPEAGQFSCFFVYLKLVVGFSPEGVAAYIGVVGVLSVAAQTGVLILLHKSLGCKKTILIGLLFQAAQLFWYGFGSQYWMMWAAGVLAALSQITYPSVSSYLSVHSDGDKQGTVQGIVTGIRGLCQGLGPALFGFIFYLFNVDLNTEDESIISGAAFAPPGAGRPKFQNKNNFFWTLSHAARQSGDNSLSQFVDWNATSTMKTLSLSAVVTDGNALWIAHQKKTIPGPPFVFGALLVTCAILVLKFLPANPTSKFFRSFRQSSITGTSGNGHGQQQKKDLSYSASDSTVNSAAAPNQQIIARRYRAFSSNNRYLVDASATLLDFISDEEPNDDDDNGMFNDRQKTQMNRQSLLPNENVNDFSRLSSLPNTSKFTPKSSAEFAGSPSSTSSAKFRDINSTMPNV